MDRSRRAIALAGLLVTAAAIPEIRPSPADAAAVANPVAYDTIAQATAAHIPAMYGAITLSGYAAVGDGGGGQYIHASAGAGAGKFQSADGQWWVLAGPTYNDKQFGAKVDGTTNDAAVINAALVYLSGLEGQAELNLVPGVRNIGTSTLLLQSYVMLVGVNRSGRGYNDLGNVGSTILSSGAGSGAFAVDTAASIVASGIVGCNLKGPGSGTAGGGIRMGTGVFECTVARNSVTTFADQGILDLGTGTFLEENISTGCPANTTRVARIGSIQYGGSDCHSYANEGSASLSALASSNLYICGLLDLGANTFHVADIGEYADVGICDGAGNNAWTICRGDHNWGPGWITSNGRYGSCIALDNSLSGDGAYSGFQGGVGAGGGLSGILTGCEAVTIGGNSHAWGFDYSNEQTSDITTITILTGCRSHSHLYGSFNQYWYYPQAVELPALPLYGNVSVPNLDGTRLYIPDGNATITGATNVVQGQTYQFVSIGSSPVIANNAPAAGNTTAPFLTNTGGNITLANNTIYEFLAIRGNATAPVLVELSGK